MAYFGSQGIQASFYTYKKCSGFISIMNPNFLKMSSFFMQSSFWKEFFKLQFSIACLRYVHKWIGNEASLKIPFWISVTFFALVPVTASGFIWTIFTSRIPLILYSFWTVLQFFLAFGLEEESGNYPFHLGKKQMEGSVVSLLKQELLKKNNYERQHQWLERRQYSFHNVP